MPRLRPFLYRALAILSIAFFALDAWAQLPRNPGSEVSTAQVRAELLAHAPQGIAPGQPLWAGLRLTHQPHWHTYWKNSGDSGQPTQLEWSLPPGVTAGEIAWPLPKKIPVGTLANYGYEDQVLLPVPLAIGPGFRPPAFGDTLDLKLKARWLVCRQECIPEEGEFALQLPLRGSTALHGAAFDAALKAQPSPVQGAHKVELQDGGKTLAVSVAGLPASLRGRQLDFFPETPNVIDNAAESGRGWTQAWQGTLWTARIPVSPQRSESPARMPLVLSVGGQGGQGWRAEAQVVGRWPAVAAPAPLPPALQAALAQNAATVAPPAAGGATELGLGLALLGALFGGLALNLMPCVFPVLAIKVLGFARHADDRRGHRIAGLAYSGGVMASFLALGGLMLGLRAAGEQLGWGFQLQSPAMVAALAVLFTVMGLNLAGLFEWGRFVPGRLAALEARHPVVNAFVSGVLAVAIASPCTAPFMGASLGFAIALPATQALAVFAALGLGMALPYLAASLAPAVARLLPRPGAWMDHFRRLMAFPMFATVAWLVWVLGQQSGIDGAGALLALLVGLSLVLWTLTLEGRARAWLATLAIAGLALLAGALGPAVVRVQDGARTVAEGERWQPWSAAKAEALLASGRPVFVDFTAAWCVTCQLNKGTLSDAQVLADFDAKRVQLLRADWTRRDPAITAALQQLGRSGIPVYVLYQAGRAPLVLTELLGVDELRTALASL
ncbi:thioredoxin family protein [Ramlibacter sp. 2FC]|uniref:protein-disulfide reductase DsbD family protein n=1 Tax=Ramlibacter sp. 2FC TaxID=2502188 RepID=UPI0010F95497|nr:thioredoxin family protein [Ramlibacter sp. 2FC]